MIPLSSSIEVSRSIHLPTELWQHIFYFATLPHCGGFMGNRSEYLNTLVGKLELPGTYEVWDATLRTKCKLSLVSRSFRSLSEHLLYERIICRNILKTIEILDEGGHRGRYVRHISLEPETAFEMMHITNENMQKIYNMCRNLESIYVDSFSWTYPKNGKTMPSLDPFHIFGSLPSTISSVRWTHHNSAASWPVNHVRASVTHLRTLALMAEYNIFVEGQLDFPHLETLHMPAALALPQGWTCPKLKYLRIVYQSSRSTLRVTAGMHSFLQTHAKRLHTLCLDSESSWADLNQTDLYLSFLSECINVQLLIVNIRVPLFVKNVVPSWTLPSLRCIAILLEGTLSAVPIPNFLGLWNGFHSQDQFPLVEQFLVLYHHFVHDKTDMGALQELFGYDRRLDFQCLSTLVA